ncbi:hypothetical protein AVEN_194373-1 [Araneus ventricosus]|uniref:Uncharacterized protein n=1 Tax=Araneus ventricosus TaxID=182803 RepID=A0A4Y2A869_ARAVE|nr:hypothetical protein AVEN_194373-1 [Araneus ventricosus]
MFHNIFDTVPERPVGNSDSLYFVLDGGSLIHRVVWPKKETFATDDANVHIVKTAIETYEKIKKQVVVIGQDVDLLVLLNALTPDYMDILMLKEGKDKIKYRFYSSKDLRNSNLVIEYAREKSILFLHAMSGCDTTLGFYGKGKLQAVQLFNVRYICGVNVTKSLLLWPYYMMNKRASIKNEVKVVRVTNWSLWNCIKYIMKHGQHEATYN